MHVMRYYFVVIKPNGATVQDNGVECATLLDAIGLDRSMAFDLATEDRQSIGGAIVVRNGQGQQVDRVAIRQRDAITITW
jgi:hypothetical protein